MKINSIGPVYKNRYQNFSGLWGRPFKQTKFDDVLNVNKTQIERYYYPFSNETQNQIKEIVKKNTGVKLDIDAKKYETRRCVVCYTLPFSEKDYKKYLNYDGETAPSRKFLQIHDYVFDKFSIDDEKDIQYGAANHFLIA